MTESTLWWLLAGAAIAIELATGTFYLLMLALGLVAGAITAHFGLSPVSQMLVAAGVGVGAVAVWHGYRQKNLRPLPANANRDVNLDIGETLIVKHWNADGTTAVKFRGAQWTAVAANPSDTAHTGTFKITATDGNRLIIEKL